MIIDTFFIPFLLATVISFLSTYPTIKLAWKLNLIDDPQKNKHPKVIHKIKTPRGGGLAIFISILLSSLIFLPLDKHLKGIICGATILTALGLLDDKYNLNPYLRLTVQFTAASMPIIAGIGIAFWKSPFGNIIDLSQPQIDIFLLGEARSIWILSDLFALFWIVAIMNFLNMGAKGVDGQLTGVVAIAALTISLLSLKFSADITEWHTTTLGAITFGSFLGFLPWHIYPQKIMPSFSGSNLGGYMLAILSILTTAKVGTLALVLAVPLIDTTYIIIRRILSGKSPVWGDNRHLHHKLLENGLSIKQVAAFYWAVTAIFGILSLFLNSENKLYTMIGVALLTGGITLWLNHKQKQ